jgi:hypothetical protein
MVLPQALPHAAFCAGPPPRSSTLLIRRNKWVSNKKKKKRKKENVIARIKAPFKAKQNGYIHRES